MSEHSGEKRVLSAEERESVEKIIADYDAGVPVRLFITGRTVDEGIRQCIKELRGHGIEVIVPVDN